MELPMLRVYKERQFKEHRVFLFRVLQAVRVYREKVFKGITVLRVLRGYKVCRVYKEYRV
jgi:PII-like signaling protein